MPLALLSGAVQSAHVVHGPDNIALVGARAAECVRYEYVIFRHANILLSGMFMRIRTTSAGPAPGARAPALGSINPVNGY